MDEADNQVWLDTLAGREVQGTHAPTVNEARALRAAVLSRRTVADSAIQVDAEEDGAAREMQLIDRARRAGLLGITSPPRAAATRRPRRGVWGALLAASVAGMAVTLVWTLRPTPDAPVYRGAPDAVHRMKAADPQQLSDEIVAALSAAGVEAVTYKRFERLGLDADLPQPLTPRVRRVLDRYHVPVPIDGVLRIEIEPAPP